MSDVATADFGDLIAARISAEHRAISSRWLDRLRHLLPVDPAEIFPSDQLLDHIPALIRHVGDHLRTCSTDAIVADTSVVAKAQELGQLRHTQRASVHQLLAEYRLLDGVLTTFVQEELGQLGFPPTAPAVVETLRRLHDAIWILTQTTVDTFVAEYTSTIASHANRLEGFNRMVSHELRQPLGTLMYALPLVRAESGSGNLARQDHLLAVLDRNIRRLAQLMEQLETLSRLQTPQADGPTVQLINVTTVAEEVARQLREMAEARDVAIRVSNNLPTIEIDMARLELILMNLMSNAIKYSDPDKLSREVSVEAAAGDAEGLASFVVRDNGLGIPEESQGRIFGRFVRVHTHRDSELGVRGSGLGLAIALECVEAVGGTIRMDSSVGQGTTFVVSVPRHPKQS